MNEMKPRRDERIDPIYLPSPDVQDTPDLCVGVDE